jgi:hypothetical protein
MMLDEDVVAVSPASIYRVLKGAGRLDRRRARNAGTGASSTTGGSATQFYAASCGDGDLSLAPSSATAAGEMGGTKHGALGLATAFRFALLTTARKR